MEQLQNDFIKGDVNLPEFSPDMLLGKHFHSRLNSNTIKLELNKDKFRYLKSISLELNDSNRGIAPGRNQALKIADEKNVEWYSTVDNDVLLPDNWLSECISLLTLNPQFAMLGVNFEGIDYPIINVKGGNIQFKRDGNLGTACTVFHKKLHKLLGWFNVADYPGGYGCEDADWGFRARMVNNYQLGYLTRNGIHLGIGDYDKGEYREFKTKTHDKNAVKFRENCIEYYNKRKSYYLPYKI